MGIKEEKEADEVTNSLYDAYGSETGVLFGIPPDLRFSVRGIIKVMLTRNITALADQKAKIREWLLTNCKRDGFCILNKEGLKEFEEL